MPHHPPYTITEKSADHLAKIVESVTMLEFGTGFKRNIRLHRENRLRTIHSSLAIEGNALTLGEVRAVVEGRLVAGKQEDVKEVKNAYDAYDRIMSFDPYSVRDFLKAHQLMMDGLVSGAGQFRSEDVGVFKDMVPIHMGVRPQFVPGLINELFDWAKESDLHPVLKSAVLHHEIEIIHPFSDGNGRMGRLWQTLLLATWKEIFAWIPMESMLFENRPNYYRALDEANKANDAGAFIEFTLSAILTTILEQAKHQDEHEDEHQDKRRAVLSDIQSSVLEALAGKALSRKEIFKAISISPDTRAFKRHIRPLLTEGLIEMTIPDKPNSKLQKYRLTQSSKPGF